MTPYTVQHQQNIWDIALLLFGSIEGVFDLFICNPQLSMTTDLKAGDTLLYHENLTVNPSIVNVMKSNDWVPANGERKVYHKTTASKLRIIAKCPSDLDSVTFSAEGDGVMIVDWGDNSALQSIPLGVSRKRFAHSFDNTVSERTIKIYGDFSFYHLDLSEFIGTIYPITQITVDNFSSVGNYGNLVGLRLFHGMITIDLRNSQIDDLSPIYDYGRDHRDTYSGLTMVDLRGVRFQSLSVIDDYLSYLAAQSSHGTRRPCTIRLDTTPSDVGMKAIQSILDEPAWNQDGFAESWKFYINDKLYTT